MDLKDYSKDLLNFSVNEFGKALGTAGDSLGTHFLMFKAKNRRK